jgi:hypothetical protein
VTRRSKYYTAGKSWTKRPAWAFEVPLDAIDAGGEILLRYETGPDTRHYAELKAPCAFLQEKLSGLWVREDRQTVSLFLSAEPQHQFTDKRGAAAISFARFAAK